MRAFGFSVNPHVQKCAHHRRGDRLTACRGTRSGTSCPTDTDGMVVKIDSYAQREKLGFTSKFPRVGKGVQVRGRAGGHEARPDRGPGRGGPGSSPRSATSTRRCGWPAPRSARPACTTPTRSTARAFLVGDTVVVEKAGRSSPRWCGWRRRPGPGRRRSSRSRRSARSAGRRRRRRRTARRTSAPPPAASAAAS